MKKNIILILVVIFVGIYWRGTKSILTKMGFDCNWHTVYAVCITNVPKVKNSAPPSFIDILRAGSKLK